MRENAVAKNSKLILDWLDNADIALANLETNLSKPRPITHLERHFIILDKILLQEEMKSMGFDLLKLANNYTFDQLVSGTEGFIDEGEALNRTGIKYVGAGMNLEEALKPVIIRAGGQKIAFLGFSNLSQKAATPNEPWRWNLRNKDRIRVRILEPPS